jgi:hypothetical protein
MSMSVDIEDQTPNVLHWSGDCLGGLYFCVMCGEGVDKADEL